MISQNQFFILGATFSSSNALHMYKFTFSRTEVDWANKIACIGSWSASDSESLISSDSSTIYSFFVFGSTHYLYFVTLSASNGSVTSARYKSNIYIYCLFSSALNADYAIAITYLPTSLIIYKISSSIFTIKNFSGTILYGCGVEPSTGR